MKKNILINLFALSSLAISAQNSEKEKNNKLKFGFNFGANYSLLSTKKPLPNNTEIYNGFGTKLGLIMDYALGKSFFISPKIEMCFNNSGTITTNYDNTKTTYEVFKTSIELMTHLVYKFGARKTLPYIVLGPHFRLPLKKKHTSSSSTFQNNADIAIDLGLGIENKLKNFDMAPEIRYTFGLSNVNQNPTIKKLNYHNISLLLNFK